MNGGDLRLLGGVHVTGGLGVGGPSGHAVEGVGTVRVDPDVVLGAERRRGSRRRSPPAPHRRPLSR